MGRQEVLNQASLVEAGTTMLRLQSLTWWVWLHKIFAHTYSCTYWNPPQQNPGYRTDLTILWEMENIQLKSNNESTNLKDQKCILCPPVQGVRCFHIGGYPLYRVWSSSQHPAR